MDHLLVANGATNKDFFEQQFGLALLLRSSSSD
jgi:hypothetical protein